MNKPGLASKLKCKKEDKKFYSCTEILTVQNQIIRSNLEKAGRIRFRKKM